MQRRKRNNKAPRRRNSGRPGGRGGVLQPPPFRPTLRVNHKFRFIGSEGSGETAVTITRANLLNLLVTATSTTTTVRTFEAVRLKKVEMWSNAPALGAASTLVQVEWLGENSPSTVFSDSSMGVRPAHVVSRPPPRSSNQWWSMSGTLESDPLFSLLMPANGIIDVVLQVQLIETESPTAGPTPSGASLGQVYGATLDGNGVTGTLVPVGYIAIP